MTTTITTAKDARAAREAQLDQVFEDAVEQVEARVQEFLRDSAQESFTARVPQTVADRVSAAYGEHGWVVKHFEGKQNLRFALPAPVAGAHPERKQPGGTPVLDFWRFVYERQHIYANRKAGGPRPWTEDPVLRDRFFTNIFRDLDPGTQVAEGIVSLERPAWERLWNLLVYRRFNREETWNKALGYWELDEVSPSKLRGMLRDRYRGLAKYRVETGQPIFTDAHQVYPMPMIPGPDLPSRFMRVMLDVFVPARTPDSVYSLADKLAAADTRKKAYAAFVAAKIPGISSFLSWQMTMDCTYGPRPLVTADDDWAPITTGARFGAIMWHHWPTLGTVNYPIEGWPSLKSVPPKELEAFVRGMRDEQDERFDERGLDFLGLEGARRLDMPALEHALCEFSKYVAAAVGLPTRDRWSQTPVRGEKAAGNKAVQAIADRMDDAIKAIDLPDLKKSHEKQGASPGQETSAAPGVTPDGDDVEPSEGQAVSDLAAERSSGDPAPPKTGGAEERFRAAIRELDGRGEEPTPRAIFAELGGTSVSLNSRQAAWRRDELGELGYVKTGGKFVKEAA